MINRIILASASPRRKDLLESAGVSFEILIPDVDETPIKSEHPKKMVARLSLLKACEISRGLANSGTHLILAADTTVVSAQNKNLGKPESIAEAIRMIRALQGKPHHVYTAYTLLKVRDGKIVQKQTRVVRTDVWIKKMSTTEIAQYVDEGESLDKAGGYAAQGKGMALIEKIKGSYTNVVGLPLSHVVEDLKKFGFKA